ncbi:hypothetical protein J2T13_005198 [Paenibacillus sp. DS2015]|uniref:lipoprotein n=1 Tax=Paenibacillus sp. DS2015 TaxID=3373917 RepID=UPI003D25C13C
MKKYLSMLLIVLILTACNEKHLSETFQELNFEPAKSDISFHLIESSFETIMEKTVNGYKTVLFKLDTEGEIYGGVYIDNILHSIGPVSMSITPNDLLVIVESNAFGKDLIRISGIPGANFVRSIYLEVDGESITPLLVIEGNVNEIDLDNDNVNEIVSTIGTIPETSIYRALKDKIVVANINVSINAQSVLFNPENQKFEVYYEPNKKYYYLYNNEKLELEE